MLLRVRDELRMTLHAYQTLYESSIAFGIRKALQAEQVNTWHIMSEFDLLEYIIYYKVHGASILSKPIFREKLTWKQGFQNWKKIRRDWKRRCQI